MDEEAAQLIQAIPWWAWVVATVVSALLQAWMLRFATQVVGLTVPRYTRALGMVVLGGVVWLLGMVLAGGVIVVSGPRADPAAMLMTFNALALPLYVLSAGGVYARLLPTSLLRGVLLCGVQMLIGFGAMMLLKGVIGVIAAAFGVSA